MRRDVQQQSHARGIVARERTLKLHRHAPRLSMKQPKPSRPQRRSLRSSSLCPPPLALPLPPHRYASSLAQFMGDMKNVWRPGLFRSAKRRCNAARPSAGTLRSLEEAMRSLARWRKPCAPPRELDLDDLPKAGVKAFHPERLFLFPFEFQPAFSLEACPEKRESKLFRPV